MLAWSAMTPSEFKRSLNGTRPPACGAALAALGWAHKGDWDTSHQLVMDQGGRDAAWVHAYLHRLEGDAANAAYWYRAAGKPVASGAAVTEWEAIVAALLEVSE